MKRILNLVMLIVGVSLSASLHCAEASLERTAQEAALIPVTAKSLHPAEIPPQDYSPMATLPREIRRITLLDKILTTSKNPQEAGNTLRSLISTNKEYATLLSNVKSTQQVANEIAQKFNITEEEALESVGTPIASKILSTIFIKKMDDLAYESQIIERLQSILQSKTKNYERAATPSEKAFITAAVETQKISLDDMNRFGPFGEMSPLNVAIGADDPYLVQLFLKYTHNASTKFNGFLRVLDRQSPNSIAAMNVFLKNDNILHIFSEYAAEHQINQSLKNYIDQNMKYKWLGYIKFPNQYRPEVVMIAKEKMSILNKYFADHGQ